MEGLNPIEEGKRYIGIKADGLFHEKCSQDTEGAKYREYKIKDRNTGVETTQGKWELLYKDLSNVHIKSIYFEDSEYGENICTTFTDGENEVTWSENTGTNFGSDWMKRLPNLDFTAKVSIKPYAFTTENGKLKKGVSVYQNDKVEDYFYDWEKKQKKHGFPDFQKPLEDMKTDDWKLYFLTVKMFLVDYTKSKILPKFEGGVSPVKSDYPTPEEEGIRPQDIPF